MGKTYLGEKREVLVRVELPDPHADKTVKALVTLKGWSAHIVEEMEKIEQKPLATLIRELVEEGIRARIAKFGLEGAAEEGDE